MRAAVIGGGVAGAASAIALARIGAAVTVYEAYNDPAGPVGSFVSLSVNGLRALDALGCLPAVQEAGFGVERQRMWSGRGKPLGDVPRGRRSGDPLHSVTLMRADLVRTLRDEAVRSGARILTDRRLTGPHDPAATGADLVVGADGIWSATRRALDPTVPEPVYAGLYSVSGTSTRTDAERPSFNMVFARRGAFVHIPAPDGTVWWSAQVASAEQPADPAAIGIDGLAALFRTEPAVLSLLGAPSSVRTGTLLHVLAPVTRRHDDRTVLVGDAAHPVGAGQGASMAIEDAVALARELASAGEIPAALTAFDRVRHDRTGKLAKTAAANRDAKTAGPVPAWFRDAFMPFFFERFYEKATGWLYDHDPGQLPAAVSGPGPGLPRHAR
ncbi:FAD-dependent oxidoreductase [Nonomuraea sp. LPB2021202275-12-8]|uniref:FAD-dependent oxidoreductase n=1 Tax=Nonomuraea sp. LPB2021202275-12-8 TaxID=3120159 RepID=UPI00300CA671